MTWNLPNVLTVLRLLAAPGVVPHPLLGDFDAASWVHLARVHTEHHLAIIDEILASEARPSRLVQ